jgi:putative oxidoreductase
MRLQTATLADVTHAILRIGVGLLFLQHGLQKIFGLFGGRQVPLTSLMGVAGILELAGGVLLIAGLFTRAVAAVLLVEMIVAFVKAHLPRGWVPIENGGELALLYAATFVFFAAHGAGAFSVDASLARRRPMSGRVRARLRRVRAA